MNSKLVTSYDRIAASYAREIAGELAGKPLDRALLGAFAEQVGALGPICDLGCGPGHVTAFLAGQGATVEGIDASGGMIAQAQRLFPTLAFRQGDMRGLDVPDQTYGGIAAFYSIIHLLPAELVPAFRDWSRALHPGGYVLVAFHVGDQIIHPDEMWGDPVDIDFRFLEPDRIAAALREAGFTIAATVTRAPYPDVEHPSDRAYLLARKAA